MPGDSGVQRGIGVVGPALIQAARRYGTPVYVMDMETVTDAAREVAAAFGPPWILQYSVKANDLPAVVGCLHDHGWGANVVSAGEWRSARYGGVPNAAVTFEGIGKTDAELEYAVRETAEHRPPRWLAIESAQEAAALAALARQYRLGRDGRAALDVLVRLNPEVEPRTRPEFAVGRPASKFGMTRREIADLVAAGPLDGPGLRLRGVHLHVGSDLRDTAAWAQAGIRAARLLSDLTRAGVPADTVDFGGGFPLREPGAPGPAGFRDALLAGLRREGLALPARPAIEPGRFLVGAAGWLVASVLHVRSAREGARTAPQVVLDAGMTEIIRPALYGSHHQAHALVRDLALAGCLPSAGGLAPAPDGVPDGNGLPPAGEATFLEGPVCESTDSLGVHRLPPLARGDLIALEHAGAYAASFTSRYNGRPHPAEALLHADGTVTLAGRSDPAA